MMTNSIDRRYDLHTADAPLSVLYREYAEAIAREPWVLGTLCPWCKGRGGDSAASCRSCGGHGTFPAPTCARCGQAKGLRDGECCDTCTPPAPTRPEPPVLDYRYWVEGSEPCTMQTRTSWAQVKAALDAALPVEAIRAGRWGMVANLTTGETYWRDYLGLGL